MLQILLFMETVFIMTHFHWLSYFIFIIRSIKLYLSQHNNLSKINSTNSFFTACSFNWCPSSHATLWAGFNITKLLANLLTKPSAFLLLCQLYCNLFPIKCIIVLLIRRAACDILADPNWHLLACRQLRHG